MSKKVLAVVLLVVAVALAYKLVLSE